MKKVLQILVSIVLCFALGGAMAVVDTGDGSDGIAILNTTDYLQCTSTVSATADVQEDAQAAENGQKCVISDEQQAFGKDYTDYNLPCIATGQGLFSTSTQSNGTSTRTAGHGCDSETNLKTGFRTSFALDLLKSPSGQYAFPNYLLSIRNLRL